MCVSAVQTSQGLYSGLASNVDFSIVALIVFGGNGSKVTWLFAKIGIPSKHMLPMVSRTSSHMFFFCLAYEHNLIVVILANSRL